MAKYIELAPQLVRLYRLDLDCKEVIKEFLLTAVTADVVDKKRYDGLLKDTVIISEALDKYQTADFVEVVRCRACKHSKKLPLGYGCKMNYRLISSGKWFCANGERRTDDGKEA